MSESVPKATGKRYRSTSEMLEDTGTPQEIIDSVKEIEINNAMAVGGFARVTPEIEKSKGACKEPLQCYNIC